MQCHMILSGASFDSRNRVGLESVFQLVCLNSETESPLCQIKVITFKIYSVKGFGLLITVWSQKTRM